MIGETSPSFGEWQPTNIYTHMKKHRTLDTPQPNKHATDHAFSQLVCRSLPPDVQRVACVAVELHVDGLQQTLLGERNLWRDTRR